jgi:hypothetical protein
MGEVVAQAPVTNAGISSKSWRKPRIGEMIEDAASTRRDLQGRRNRARRRERRR